MNTLIPSEVFPLRLEIHFRALRLASPKRCHKSWVDHTSMGMIAHTVAALITKIESPSGPTRLRRAFSPRSMDTDVVAGPSNQDPAIFEGNLVK